MARRRRFHQFPSRRPIKKPPPTAFILLDRFSIDDIHNWAAFKDQIIRFHWDYYSSLAYQRSKIADEIKKSLLEAAQKNFKFAGWQRAVKYKYTLMPLSVEGSLRDPAGGRFNIGDINPFQFTPFPALYIAFDSDTARQELLNQKFNLEKEQKLNSLDFALTTSISTVSLSGSLDSIINLSEPERLKPFVDLIKDFDIPDSLKEIAREIRLPEPNLVRTVSTLVNSLLHPNWREWPIQFDVPFSSQIFGQLIASAGIDGILYPSKFTDRDCLAIFPQNFDDSSSSFIELDGELPPGIKIVRLNANVRNKLNN